MSSFTNQSLLTGIHLHHPESPIMSYESDPDYSLHRNRNRNGSPMITNRRTHRRNKKNVHKSKQRKLEILNKLKNKHSIWISELIKQDKNKENHIDCISVCKSYDFAEINVSFNNDEYLIFARYEDALHFKLNNNNNNNINSYNLQCIVDGKDIFVFQKEGVVVFWNINETNRNEFILLLKPFQINYPIDELSQHILPQFDSFDYEFGDNFDIENGVITLSMINCFDKNYIETFTEYVNQNSIVDIDENNEFVSDPVNWKAVEGVLMLQKLAISFGLAQSLKLTVFEIRIDENIELNEDIPKQMAFNGSIGLNGKQIGQRMGRLFIARSELNLHSDIFSSDVEHFYEVDLFGKEYIGVREYLNIDKRIEIINSRFDLLHELFQIVMSQQETSHASKLEWIVIWLIVVEIILGIIELVIEYTK